MVKRWFVRNAMIAFMVELWFVFRRFSKQYRSEHVVDRGRSARRIMPEHE
jgi:hypothetical protein